jgi:hypothetical protein
MLLVKESIKLREVVELVYQSSTLCGGLEPTTTGITALAFSVNQSLQLPLRQDSWRPLPAQSGSSVKNLDVTMSSSGSVKLIYESVWGLGECQKQLAIN